MAFRTLATARHHGMELTDLDAQWDKLTRKFHALVDPILGREAAAQLAEKCRHLEHEGHLDSFWRLIGGKA